MQDSAVIASVVYQVANRRDAAAPSAAKGGAVDGIALMMGERRGPKEGIAFYRRR